MEWAPDPIELPAPGYRRASLSLGAGWHAIDEDHFIAIDAGAVLDFGAFRLGLHAPLNLRVIDEAPDDDGVVRKEDWDEPSEWFRVIRFVEVGERNRGPLYARYGELVSADIGHATIVHAYHNTIDPDHYQAGLRARVDLGPYGAELLLDNLVDPEIWGTRLFARPFRIAGSQQQLLRRLAVGLSVIGDASAPAALRRDGGNRIIVDDKRVIDARRDNTAFLGVDLEAVVLDRDEIVVLPYLDFNSHLGVGSGLHLGVHNLWTPAQAFRLSMRLEYRLLGSGYLPGYVSAAYEKERFDYARDATGAQLTKLAYARSDLAATTEHGFFGELGATILETLLIRGAYEGSGRAADDSLWLQAALPWVGPVKLQATWLKRNAHSFESLFEPDGALAAIEAHVRVFGPLAVWGLYTREWRVRDDDPARRGYASVDTWQVGVGVEFQL